MTKKYIIHIVGFILIAFGVATMAAVDFGLSPIDAFNYHIYLLFNSPHIKFGTISIMTSTLLTLISFIVTKAKDAWISLALAIILGLSIDLFGSIYGHYAYLYQGVIVLRLILLIIGLTAITFGVIFTVMTKLPPSPFERTMVILNHKLGGIFYGKFAIEALFFTMALLLGLLLDPSKRTLSVFSIIYVVMMPIFTALLMKLIKGEKKDEHKSVY